MHSLTFSFSPRGFPYPYLSIIQTFCQTYRQCDYVLEIWSRVYWTQKALRWQLSWKCTKREQDTSALPGSLIASEFIPWLWIFFMCCCELATEKHSLGNRLWLVAGRSRKNGMLELLKWEAVFLAVLPGLCLVSRPGLLLWEHATCSYPILPWQTWSESWAGGCSQGCLSFLWVSRACGGSSAQSIAGDAP